MKRFLKQKSTLTFLLMLFDIVIIFLSGMFSYLIFNMNLKGTFFPTTIYFLIGWSCLSIVVFLCFHLYSTIWKYAGISEFVRTIISMIIIFCVSSCIELILEGALKISFVSLRWCLITTLFQLFFCMLFRFMPKSIEYFKNKLENKKIKANTKSRVMVVGAGSKGANCIQLFRTNKDLNAVPICLIDDDSSKLGRIIDEIKVVGNSDDIPRMVAKYKIDLIVIAIADMEQDIINNIKLICKDTYCTVETYNDLLNN